MSGEGKPPISVRELLLPALGAVILLIGVGLAAVTERGQIDYRSQVKRHGGDVLDLGSNGRPDADEQGYMVRVVGPLQVVEAPLDPQFNQQTDQPVLIRRVQMFQWHEVRYGGPASYELDWEDHPVDSSHFERAEGHINPVGKFPIDDGQFDAGLVRLNDFMLSPALVHALTGSQPVSPDLRNLPSNLAASFSLYDDHLVTSAVPSNPQPGDLRVSWEAVPAQTVTIVAKVDGNKLIPASDAADGVGFAVQPGDVPLADIFPDLPLPPDYLWLRRIFFALLGSLGAVLLVRWYYKTIDPILAPSIAVLVIGAVDAVLWLGNDAAPAAGWFGFAIVGAALAAWRVRVLRAR
jgi:transmembrane protein TMEM43